MRSTVRTYMNYPEIIDPAHILSMADLELAISLASTLVTFDDNRSPIAGLAKSWHIEGQKIKFILRDGLKWSNGEKITAEHYRLSLLRAKKLYSGDLKAFFDSVEKIEAPNEGTVVIRLLSHCLLIFQIIDSTNQVKSESESLSSISISGV